MEKEINKEVAKAIKGDRDALETILIEVKDLIYNLSLRMLLYPEDAEDATQEILIKIITRLSTFKGKSSFNTWVYRVATNYLLTYKGKMSSNFAVSFEEYGEFIDAGHSENISFTQNKVEQKLLEEEVKISCTHGLLLCLDKKSRMTYILGDIFEFSSKEGAEFMEISADNFRQILHRTRKKIHGFLRKRCGVVEEKNACRCRKKVDYLIGNGAIDPERLRFATHTKRSIDLLEKIDVLHRSFEVYRTVPKFAAPSGTLEGIRKMLTELDL